MARKVEKKVWHSASGVSKYLSCVACFRVYSTVVSFYALLAIVFFEQLHIQ